MQNTPLYNALIRHKNLGISSFHTPGHKCSQWLLGKNLLELDYTELPDTDSLFEASGAILRAEEEATKLFGTAKTLFSAGGCTLCIQAMIRLCAPCGGKIVCSRVIHRSAINTMALLGVDPIWVYPRQDAGEGLAGRTQPSDVAKALSENPNAKAVYITSPDYFGVISDIRGISLECKKYNVPLIVDNAHGAHLSYVGGDLHPISKGADMAACSAHKTLPVLTGGAWLSISNEDYTANAKSAMALFASTSPSYPVMASLDLCREWLSERGLIEFNRLETKVLKIKQLAANKGINMPQGLCDPIRISLNTASVGISGQDAAKFFRAKGLEPEYADENYVVFIATPMNTEEDFARLEGAINELPKGAPLEIKPYEVSRNEQAVSARFAVLSETERLPIEKCEGRIAAEAACPCPPGVPIVMHGEVINRKSIDCLIKYGVLSLNVLK